jgi:hypothetical protein
MKKPYSYSTGPRCQRRPGGTMSKGPYSARGSIQLTRKARRLHQWTSRHYLPRATRHRESSRSRWQLSSTRCCVASKQRTCSPWLSYCTVDDRCWGKLMGAIAKHPSLRTLFFRYTRHGNGNKKSMFKAHFLSLPSEEGE